MFAFLKIKSLEYNIECWYFCSSTGDLADLIFVFFDPIGQALCKRTLNIVEKLNEKHADRMRFYLSKADEAGHESDRQVRELAKRLEEMKAMGSVRYNFWNWKFTLLNLSPCSKLLLVWQGNEFNLFSPESNFQVKTFCFIVAIAWFKWNVVLLCPWQWGYGFLFWVKWEVVLYT